VTSLRYLYAIFEADPAAAAWRDEEPLLGVEAAPVRPLVEGALAGAVSDVPASDFDEGPLNEHVRDLDWLGPRALAHQQVNAHLFERVDAVLPLAFGAVFRDDNRVRRLLREQRADFLGRLARVRGRAEWVVTVHRDEAAALAALERSSTSLRDLRAQVEASSPGRAYLLKRREAELRREELLAGDAEATRAVVAALAGHAEDTYREAIAEGVRDGAITRVSFLVPRSREADFVDTVERLREHWCGRGYLVAPTGPWPPYRFGGLQLGGIGAAR
jgi:gas vesicle protein GvpL/GvpF